MNEFETKITNVTQNLKETLVAKNHDYGDSLHKQVQRDGIRDVVLRCEEKIDRLLTLTDKDHEVKVADESIYDTLRDLAGYAILSLIEMNDQKSLAEQKQLIDENTKKLAEQSKQLDTQFPLPK